MQLEFQEYVGHQEYKKAAAASNTRAGNTSEVSRSETMSPRRVPSSTTPRKQFQILVCISSSDLQETIGFRLT